MTTSLPQLQEILTNNSIEIDNIKSDIAKAKELIESCDARLNQLSGNVSTVKETPKKTLRQFIRDALNQSNEPLTIKEIAELVLEAGYKTTSNNNFANIVQQTIYNDIAIKRKTKAKIRPVRYSMD